MRQKIFPNGNKNCRIKHVGIVSDADLKEAASRQEAYLQAQMGTVSGTIHNISKKRGVSCES